MVKYQKHWDLKQQSGWLRVRIHRLCNSLVSTSCSLMTRESRHLQQQQPVSTTPEWFTAFSFWNCVSFSRSYPWPTQTIHSVQVTVSKNPRMIWLCEAVESFSHLISPRCAFQQRAMLTALRSAGASSATRLRCHLALQSPQGCRTRVSGTL